jgi:hypothetical protein
VEVEGKVQEAEEVEAEEEEEVHPQDMAGGKCWRPAVSSRNRAVRLEPTVGPSRFDPDLCNSQGTSIGGGQFLSNIRSNRHIVPLYGISDRLFTRVFRFEER